MSTEGPPRSLGIRHLALRVRNLEQSKAFYTRVFGMRPVWEPDPHTSYLTSGSDNLALHQITAKAARNGQTAERDLDHFGFLMESPAVVDRMLQWLEHCGAPIMKAPKWHRDGSYSFYLADPDGNVIQVLYEPRWCTTDPESYT